MGYLHETLRESDTDGLGSGARALENERLNACGNRHNVEIQAPVSRAGDLVLHFCICGVRHKCIMAIAIDMDAKKTKTRRSMARGGRVETTK